MSNAFKHRFWALSLAVFCAPAMAVSSGQMSVGLRIIAAPVEATASDDSTRTDIDAPVQCESSDLGYRECTTPFRGAARMSHVVSDVMCIEGGNWGWRDGAVWVDRGCKAVFVKAAAGDGAATQGTG